ncbi:MAG: DUF58 domain-containing protein [Candidatus Hodarchaeales archaeon]|jgi:uncharacterized protein (DUF58 family)
MERKLKRNSRLAVTFSLALILYILTFILKYWIIAGLILPLLLIFYFSLSIEEANLSGISVKRSISRSRTEVKGDLIEVILKVKNSSARVPILEITDNVPYGCTVEIGSNHWILELDTNEEVVLSYSIRFHLRGRHKIGPIYLRASDIFHYYHSFKEIRSFNPISVVPSLIKIRHLPVYRQRLLPESGSVPSLIYKGRDFDFQGVREYQLGDEVRSINWRVTAKYNDLATNEYALDQAAKILIIFDHTTSAERVLEEGVMAALSSSEYLISQRNKVGFFAVGEFIERIPPAMGKRQLLRINEYLIDTKGSYPSHDPVFELRLNQLLHSSIPSLSQIIFISPLYNAILTDFLIQLVKEGHNLIHIYPRLTETDEYEKRAPKASKIANSILALEREHVLSRVANLGIQQIHWYPHGPKYETTKVHRAR